MKRRFIFFLLILAVMIVLAEIALATTWCKIEVVCPICGTKNSFETMLSSGSYIYDWPSKYQYIFWPLTDTRVVYCCKKCYLSCFVWDFKNIPAYKHKAIKNQLEDVTFEREYESYIEIPVTKRLEIAEKIYSVLERDDEFWCRFYRVMGYHYDEAGNKEKAAESRKKALELASKMLGEKEYGRERKELLLISGAMNHLLGNEKIALSDMNEAIELTYKNERMSEEEAGGLDRYLSELLKEYIKIVEHSSMMKSFKERASGPLSAKEKATLADEIHKKGLMVYDEEKYEDAITLWLLEIELAPERVRPYRNIGLTYRKLGDLDTAQKYHEKAIKIDPKFGRTYYSLGLVYYDREDYRKAIDLFLKAIKNKHGNADVYYSLGQAYRILENNRKAIEAYKKVVELNSKYPGVHYALGESYRSQDKFEIAKEEFRREDSEDSQWKKWSKIALLEIDTEIDPTDVDAFFNLGLLYNESFEEEYFEKGFKTFKRVAELDPLYPGVHYLLGKIYEKKDDSSTAEQEYMKEIQINPNNIDAREAIGRIKMTFPRYKFSVIEPAELSEEVTIKRMIQLQDYWKKISFEALNLFRDADSKVATLIDYMDKNAYYSLPIGPVSTQFASTKEQWDAMKNNPCAFEIVYMPEEYAQDMPSSILTESGGKTLRIATDFKVKEWLGIMLAHELYHIHEQLVSGENPKDPEQYLAGEVEAHLFEMRLLEFWNKDAYEILISKGIPLYKSHDEIGLFGLFGSLYPLYSRQVSRNESALGRASCLVAVAFEEALKREATKKELGQIYKSLKEGKLPLLDVKVIVK
jgi:tetratricopeptide (TPR) repeat protein